MASASKETVTRVVSTTVEEEEVVLRLSPTEAEVLRVMVSDSCVWGEFVGSDRESVERIRVALVSAGISLNTDRAARITGSLNFLPRLI